MQSAPRDSFQERVSRFTAMGYEQEEVAVALIACSDDQEPTEDKACSFVLLWVVSRINEFGLMLQTAHYIWR